MRTAKDRLVQLLRLAAEGEGARLQLVHELMDVLIDWPSEYGVAAKLPFEVLLEKTIRRADETTRTAIVAAIARRGDAPLDLLNQIYFAAPPELKDLIVACNEHRIDCRDEAGISLEEEALLKIARMGGEEFQTSFARAIGVSKETARDILDDTTALSLALVCKGTRASRATFSALATLSDRSPDVTDSYGKLASYDSVPPAAAARMLAFWRSQNRRLPPVIQRAAE